MISVRGFRASRKWYASAVVIDKQGYVVKIYVVMGASCDIFRVVAHIGRFVEYSGCSLDNKELFVCANVVRACLWCLMIVIIHFFKLLCVHFVDGDIVQRMQTALAVLDFGQDKQLARFVNGDNAER